MSLKSALSANMPDVNVPIPPPASVSASMPAAKSSFFSKFKLSTPMIIVAVLFIAGAWYIYQKNKDNKKKGPGPGAAPGGRRPQGPPNRPPFGHIPPGMNTYGRTGLNPAMQQAFEESAAMQEQMNPGAKMIQDPASVYPAPHQTGPPVYPGPPPPLDDYEEGMAMGAGGDGNRIPVAPNCDPAEIAKFGMPDLQRTNAGHIDFEAIRAEFGGPRGKR